MNSYTFKTTHKVKQLTETRRKSFFIMPHLVSAGQVLLSYWDGGSKSVYSVVNILTGLHYLPPVHGGLFDKSEEKEWVPAPGDVLICCGTFCGKPSYPNFSCLEADVTALKTFLGVV